VTVRATKRGAERTSLDGEQADVLICGASFAGLAVARELAGSGADVLVVDRYEIGERATSACAAPTPWLHAMGVERSIRQELECMSFHTPHGSTRFRLPWSWSSFDYRELCAALWEQADARFEIATVRDRLGEVVRTDRGDVTAPLIVHASLNFAAAVLAEASLSFLGLGNKPPNPSWGSMVASSYGFLQQAPWAAIFPGTAIALVVLGFNLLGDGLRDALDPRLRGAIRQEK